MKDKLLKKDQVFLKLPISNSTLYRLAKKEKLLKPIKIGGSSFWSLNSINSYIDKCKNMITVKDPKCAIKK
jgi:prophage regulatory protein